MAQKTAKTSVKITPSKEQPQQPDRRDFLTTVFGMFAGVGAVAAVLPFVRSLSPSRDVAAQATTEVDLSDIAEGSSKTVMWRGKPIFILHRNAEQIAAAKRDDGAASLLDPQNDADRVKKEKWLVVSAICTHLGCVPGKGGQHGGWLCPCHGSQFDTSGRLRRGPAASNLEVPPYEFLNDTTIRIG